MSLFGRYIPLVGRVNLLQKGALFLLACVTRFALWAVLRANDNARDPVLQVTYHRQSGYMRYQVLDLHALAQELLGATQQSPELKQ